MREIYLEMFAEGTPKPAGSKNGFAIRKQGQYTGRVAIVDSSGKKGKQWRNIVAEEARACFQKSEANRKPLEGALYVEFEFLMARPKSHYGTGRNADKLKSNAPSKHTIKPDSSKLTRSSEDALTGVVWKDDAQIVTISSHKRYVRTNERPGVLITVMED